jgi:hypothetical protein
VTELYLKNEGALEDYLLDSMCRETVLNRGAEPPLENAELARWSSISVRRVGCAVAMSS